MPRVAGLQGPVEAPDERQLRRRSCPTLERPAGGSRDAAREEAHGPSVAHGGQVDRQAGLQPYEQPVEVHAEGVPDERIDVGAAGPARDLAEAQVVVGSVEELKGEGRGARGRGEGEGRRGGGAKSGGGRG